jgi:hypothetical protein
MAEGLMETTHVDDINREYGQMEGVMQSIEKDRKGGEQEEERVAKE